MIPPPYPILIAPELLKKMPRTVRALFKQEKLKPVHKFVIITDHAVKKLYGEKLLSVMKNAGFYCKLFSFAPGETSKNQATKEFLETEMFRSNCSRDTMILALGGGIVGDLAGFVAATYMRGIPYIHIPTTLLAMIDSSIGGKVGINNSFGKNLIGAFHNPSAIFVDTDFLKNLPEKAYISGLFEMVKIFLTYDKKYFNLLSKNLDNLLSDFSARSSPLLRKLIKRAMQLKVGVVTRDFFEANERMVVNFGHTIGHALELLSNYSLSHGVAVGYGMLVESKMAQLLDFLPSHDYEIVREILAKMGIDENFFKKLSANNILKIISHDKKSVKGKSRWVILEAIGRVKKTNGQFSYLVPERTVKKTLKHFTP